MSYRRIRQLDTVRQEFDAANAALHFSINHWTLLQHQTESHTQSLSGFLVTKDHLEGTYLIRLFSEFEAILRDSLIEKKRRVPRIALILIDRVALMENIANDIRNDVHQVRECRNSIVHAGSIASSQMRFSDARAALNRFLAWLSEPPV